MRSLRTTNVSRSPWALCFYQGTQNVPGAVCYIDFKPWLERWSSRAKTEWQDDLSVKAWGRANKTKKLEWHCGKVWMHKILHLEFRQQQLATSQWWDVSVKSFWFCFCLCCDYNKNMTSLYFAHHTAAVKCHSQVRFCSWSDFTAQRIFRSFPTASLSLKEASYQLFLLLPCPFSILGAAAEYVYEHREEKGVEVLWNYLISLWFGLSRIPCYQGNGCDAGNRDTERQTDSKQDRQPLRVTSRNRKNQKGGVREKEK